MTLNLGSLKVLGSSALESARPAALGDTLSFNPHPVVFEDLIECTVKTSQDGDCSEQYMVFKAKNVTAGDTEPCVSVFVQATLYGNSFSTDPPTFKITKEWQYGQSDKTGAGRFVVFRDKQIKTYQHYFVANLLVELENLVHDALCSKGHWFIADNIERISEASYGEYLYTFGSAVAQCDDILLVPSELPSYGFHNPVTIKWSQGLFDHESGDYYGFIVHNQTQKGQDVMFFIQKEWWDVGSTSEHHISKIAKKNKTGKYEFIVDAKSQYGQSHKSGKDRWVVYHDQRRKPRQNCFITAMLDNNTAPAQTKMISEIFGLKPENVVEEAVENYVKDLFGDELETFL